MTGTAPAARESLDRQKEMARQPPYLIQQVMITADGQQETVVQLAQLSSR